jgi:hypothetical protein
MLREIKGMKSLGGGGETGSGKNGSFYPKIFYWKGSHCSSVVKSIDIESSKIDCLRFVVCPLLAQLITGFFSSFSAAAIHSTNEANKADGTCH